MGIIAIDARKYYDFGIGTYIQRLVANVELLNHPHKFVLYVSPDDYKSVPASGRMEKRIAAYKKYSIGEALFLGRTARKSGCDLFHSPHYTLPAGLDRRSVVTIHDLIHLSFPAIFSPVQRVYSFAMIRHAVHHSGMVIADSDYTKKDILKFFGIGEDKIVVVHLGVGEEFTKASSGRVRDFRSQKGLSRPYCLFVGNTKPHKGVGNLLRAFHEAGKRMTDCDLVFAGGSFSQNSGYAQLARELGLAERIQDLGSLSRQDLVLAYSGASVFVLPSLYEGFGLPAIEAMACGVPVVVSDGGALPEVVGDAALIIGKNKIPELASAIVEVFRNSTLARDLIQKGERQARRYSWKTTAQKTLDVYNMVLQA